MLPINKELASYIRKHCPKAHIPSTCKEKSKGRRKHRFAEESVQIKRLIQSYINQLKVVEEFGEN